MILSAIISFLSANMLYFALHLENTGSFPKPLSPSKERELFEKMKDGDVSAHDALIEHNLRLVAHIVKKYYAVSNEQEDLISIGTIGLIKAVNTFSYEKGARFATYASRCIENEILMHFRNVKKTAGNVYFNDPIDSDGDGNSLTIMDIMAEDDNIADILDLKIKTEQLKKYISESLDEREQQIILMRYGIKANLPMTQREVASVLGISRSYV